jgi:hypothetical protein
METVVIIPGPQKKKGKIQEKTPKQKLRTRKDETKCQMQLERQLE